MDSYPCIDAAIEVVNDDPCMEETSGDMRIVENEKSMYTNIEPGTEKDSSEGEMLNKRV